MNFKRIAHVKTQLEKLIRNKIKKGKRRTVSERGGNGEGEEGKERRDEDIYIYDEIDIHIKKYIIKNKNKNKK